MSRLIFYVSLYPCTYDWIYSPLTRYSSKRLEGGDYRLNWKYVTFCKVQPKNVRDQNIEQISQIAWDIIWVRTSQCVLDQINFIVISSCRVLEARTRMNLRHLHFCSCKYLLTYGIKLHIVFEMFCSQRKNLGLAFLSPNKFHQT